MTPRLPSNFARGLDSYNKFALGLCGIPPIRVRWSEYEQRWRVEQRFRCGCAEVDERTYLHFKSGKASPETLTCYQDGFQFLWAYDPRTDPSYVNTGWRRDGLPALDKFLFILKWNAAELMGQTGTHARDAELSSNEADARYDKAVSDHKAKVQRMSGDVACEAWEDLCWEEKRRVAVPR